jgi:hypothetical protein
MRRIVMFNNVSAEGYFADANGGLDWVVDDPEFDKAVTAGALSDGSTRSTERAQRARRTRRRRRRQPSSDPGRQGNRSPPERASCPVAGV